jgi:hypothetical protein
MKQIASRNFDLEDGGDVFLRNVVRLSTDYRAL